MFSLNDYDDDDDDDDGDEDDDHSIEGQIKYGIESYWVRIETELFE